MNDLKKLAKKLCSAAETLIDKLVSRKLIVWLVATHLTYMGLLSPHDWLMVALLYIGAQSALDWKTQNANPIPGLHERKSEQV